MIKKYTVVDLQDNDISDEVDEEVHQLWRDMEFGNDWYYYTWNGLEDAESYPAIAKYLSDNKVEGNVLIHWWW